MAHVPETSPNRIPSSGQVRHYSLEIPSVQSHGAAQDAKSIESDCNHGQPRNSGSTSWLLQLKFHHHSPVKPDEIW